MSNIPKGYKQTEVGVIPMDWEVRKLGEVVYFRNGKAHEQGISESGKYIVINSKFISTEGGVKKFSDSCLCPVYEEEIVMVMSDVPNGKAIAKCFYIDKNDKYTLNQRICSLKATDIDSRFLFYQVNRHPYYLTFDDGVKQTNLRKDDVLGCPLKIPPSKTEQTAIAAVLSDADALISSLEKLIAKKRNIKQGAMQELLTGKKRLPGFEQKKGYKQSEVGVIPNDWRVKPLGELFTFSGGFSATRDQLSDNGFCYLHYGDIHNSKKTFIDVSEEYQEIPKLKIPLKSVSAKSLLNEGDIVFVDASEDDEGASKHIVVRNRKCIVYISGLHTIVAKSKDESLDNLYKQFCFQTVNVKKQFKFFAVGTKVTGISKTNITKIHIPLPQKPEQTAIAKILTDMGAEIEALEEKLEKYKMVKQGMMRELLTGKTMLHSNIKRIN